MNLDYHGLFSHHIQSPKRGLDQNQFTGFCCFHNDKKTRSFSFNLETGLWHCFAGCGNGNAYQVSKELGHSSVKVTEKYAKFQVRRLAEDFPKLAKKYVPQRAIPLSSIGIRFRDTDSHKSTITDGVFA